MVINKKITPENYDYHVVSPKQKTTTKDSLRVVDTMFQAIYKQDWDALKAVYAENYVQHSPYMNDGVQGVVDLFSPIDLNSAVYDLVLQIAEGPYIINVSKFQPSPESPQMVAVDINFIRDGKSREHWDIMAMCNFNGADGYSFFSSAFDNITVTDAQQDDNKLRAAQFINRFFNQKDYDAALTEFVHKDLIEHTQDTPLDFEAMKVAANQGTYDTYEYHIQRIVASDDLVCSHARVFKYNEKFAVADIFRMRDGKIIEHWNVSQPVPETHEFNHNNGMF